MNYNSLIKKSNLIQIYPEPGPRLTWKPEAKLHSF